MIELQSYEPVPLPRNESVGISAALRAMSVGQHFDLPVAKRKSLQYATWWHRKNPANANHRFVTRTITLPTGDKIVRCWRAE